MKLALSTLILAVLTGCTTLSRSDQAMLRELESHGIPPTEQQIKHPGLAGGLNILPGFGNFYLAVGTHESAQWLYGLLNLLFWPSSVVWGIPQAAIDAITMNKKETVYYYKFDRQGKKEYEELKSELERYPPSNAVTIYLLNLG